MDIKRRSTFLRRAAQVGLAGGVGLLFIAKYFPKDLELKLATGACGAIIVAILVFTLDEILTSRILR